MSTNMTIMKSNIIGTKDGILCSSLKRKKWNLMQWNRKYINCIYIYIYFLSIEENFRTVCGVEFHFQVEDTHKNPETHTHKLTPINKPGKIYHIW